MLRLLLATNNKGKITEYRSLLGDLPLELFTPQSAGITMDVAETGTTYEENSGLKAAALAKLSGLIALADDSGLEVDALGGEPGIRSSRYAGEDTSDPDKVNFLLGRLAGVPWNKRTARFRCVIAVAAPDGRTRYCRGECSGYITLAPAGSNGFGYDPLFFFPELNKTMAELEDTVKNRISHRGRAAKQVPDALKKLGIELKK
jgi:XTP/dITP diphosphohydrolase